MTHYKQSDNFFSLKSKTFFKQPHINYPEYPP